MRDRLECGPFIRDFYRERSEFTKITLIWNSVFIAFVDELGGWGVSSAVPGHHLAEPNGGFRSWARRFPDHFEVILALFQNLTIFSVFWLYSKTLPFLAYFGRFLDHFEPILARYENLTTLEKWLIENGLFWRLYWPFEEKCRKSLILTLFLFTLRNKHNFRYMSKITLFCSFLVKIRIFWAFSVRMRLILT